MLGRMQVRREHAVDRCRVRRRVLLKKKQMSSKRDPEAENLETWKIRLRNGRIPKLAKSCLTNNKTDPDGKKGGREKQQREGRERGDKSQQRCRC